MFLLNWSLIYKNLWKLQSSKGNEGDKHSTFDSFYPNEIKTTLLDLGDMLLPLIFLMVE